MTDTTGPSAPKNAGPKPRLSLLSSKQSTRIRSEDYPADHAGLETSLSGDAGPHSNGITSRSDPATYPLKVDDPNLPPKSRSIMPDKSQPGTRDPNRNGADQHSTLPGNVSERGLGGADKMSVSKEDLLGLLSMLKSENQSKDIALASIKLEQLKRLINPVEISRSALAKTYMQLQDQLHAKDQLKNGNIARNSLRQGQKNSSSSSASEGSANYDKEEKNLGVSLVTSSSQASYEYDNDKGGQESIDILNALLELLDKHPLLALPRDSIYCLDYSCNELSTKNYLNLKIQHLENLIDQHRRFRYHIGERLKQSEQRFMDLTLKLEYERNLRLDKEKTAFRSSGKAVLLKQIDELNNALEKEKASKHAIVMTLLNELLDERERNENLSNKVIDLERRLSDPSRTQLRTSPTANQQSAASKPRIPAKPAQLLDRQRSQSKNK